MNFAIINAVLATDMSIGERLSYGLQVFVVGMLTVFSALAILWGVMVLFKIFMYDLPQKKAQKKADAELASISSSTKGTAPVAEESDVAASDDTQLIAVITAAVAAYTASSGSALPFRVVSYKRVRGSNGWSGADENESI